MIAEVVYVLTKVYDVPREKSSEAIRCFLRSRNIICKEEEVTLKELQLFGGNKLDFVDNILLSYHRLKGISIYSYDKKLMKAVNRFGTDYDVE